MVFDRRAQMRGRETRLRSKLKRQTGQNFETGVCGKMEMEQDADAKGSANAAEKHHLKTNGGKPSNGVGRRK